MKWAYLGGLGMKKLYIVFFFVLSFFPLTVFESQPPEYGLIFNGYKTGTKDKKLCSNASKMKVIREKRKDGSDSIVFKVVALPQFLFLSTMQPKPVVIGVFSTSKDIQGYQQLADNLKDDALFISIDVSDSLPLVKLLFMILRFEGVDLLHQKDKFPLFLFCEKDFVLLQKNGKVSFKIGRIKPLGRAEFKPDQLLQNVKDILKLDETKSYKKEFEVEGEKERVPSSFWDKLKKWFSTNRAKLFNKLFMSHSLLRQRL